MVDFSSSTGQRAAERLAEEKIIWLTTVDSRGYPQTRPVWFYWHENSILICSRPQGFKIKHIKVNPKVSLNFDTDGKGGDITVLLGEARILDAAVPDSQLPDYLEKYERDLKRFGLTPEEFQQQYSVKIVITISSLRGY